MFDQFVIKRFLDSANRSGDNNALCIGGKFHTYNDFTKHISKIRKALKVRKGDAQIIGLVANDDVETYASIFAIWFEGLSYVPLHPKQPVERNRDIVALADIDLVLSSEASNLYASKYFICTAHLIFENIDLVPVVVDDDSLAYMLFTSGSTGVPKGVQITRKNIGAFMKSFWETGFEVTHQDKILQCFDLTFDVSVQAYLTGLTSGACIYTIPHDQIKFSYVYGLLEDHKLTFCIMAPSMIRFLRPYFDEILAESVRYCILTAEASPLDLAMEWQACIPNAVLFNFYGPTEATIYCTYHKLNRSGTNKQLNGMLSIGKPMPGVIAAIVDENFLPVGVHEKGQLCISGDQVTKGYWKNPEKNKDSFYVVDSEGLSIRYYKTGDLCYWDEDGDIMLSGRMDYQVKIQGYRIELGEIEFHAREYLKGKNAVAVAIENKTGINEIILFIETEDCQVQQLAEYLKSKIPPYMLPAHYSMVHTFPLNANGKVDRIALKKNYINI